MLTSTILHPSQVAAYPRPGMAYPEKLAFSPDDHWITYLYSPNHSLERQLYVYNLSTFKHQILFSVDSAEGEALLSAEEKLQRERTRTRATGVTDYAWLSKTSRIFISISGSMYVIDKIGDKPRLLLRREQNPMLDPQCAPDGRTIAYVRNAEIYLIDVDKGQPRQLTFGAQETGITHGLAEYIAQEEMGRHHGFWWSPDSQYIAYTEVDECNIPFYCILHQGENEPVENQEEKHHYPFAGKVNAKVRLGVVGVRGDKPTWMELGDDPDTYLARVHWCSNDALVVQVENRAQTELRLMRCHPKTGECSLLLRETNLIWINLHNLFKSLNDGQFIWGSERSGFMHLYLYNETGTLARQLTSGAWMVDTLEGVDEVQGKVYFTGTCDSELERHLYMISLEGGQPQRLTLLPGYHDVRLDHAKNFYLDTCSTPEQPPDVTLHSLEDGTELRNFSTQSMPPTWHQVLTVPDYVELATDNGVLLHGMIYHPPKHYGKGPFPTIVSVYGGPHAQQVTRSWSATVDMRAQYLSQSGFLVFKLDNRGSSRRGHFFEGAIKNNLGDVEVQDQVTGVQWLVSQGLSDPNRVGIYGWSYGGYMALLCLSKAPETYKAAVAGAPVTHWDGYDTHYTERYMGTPKENPEGYHNSSVMTHVSRLSGKLLLVHGLIDENVHFRHTARLINALIRSGKPYELLLFPEERHMPRRLEERIYLETKIRDFFIANL